LAENNTAYKGVNELVGLQCQLSVGCVMDLANGPDGSIAQCVEMLPYPCQQWAGVAPAIQVGSFSHSAIESSGPLANYITQLTTANEQLKLEPWAGEGRAW